MSSHSSRVHINILQLISWYNNEGKKFAKKIEKYKIIKKITKSELVK